MAEENGRTVAKYQRVMSGIACVVEAISDEMMRALSTRIGDEHLVWYGLRTRMQAQRGGAKIANRGMQQMNVEHFWPVRHV